MSEPKPHDEQAAISNQPTSIARSPELADAEAVDMAPGLTALTGGDDRAATAREMLYDVIDPELGVDIVNLGLLRSVEIDGETANVVFTVTTPACPLSSYIEDEIRSCLWQLPGLKTTNVTCVYDPPWKPEDMTDFARSQLGWDEM